MPSNREIAERIVGGCVDRDSVETRAEYYARTIADALDAADQRGFERAREMAAKETESAKLPDGYRWGRDALEQFDFGKERAAAAIRSIPYTAENTELSSSPPKKDKRREAWEAMKDALYNTEAVMAIVRPRSHTAEYLRTFDEVCAALALAEAERL